MRPGYRLLALGAVFIALFSVLTLRLWYLQVTEAATLDQQAENQRIRLVTSPAPRGEIVDRDGVKLAGSRVSLSVVVDRELIDEDSEDEVIQRLAGLLDISAIEVRARFNEARAGSLGSISNDVDADDALYLVDHSEDFPGVRVEAVAVRTYPEGELGAHVIGYIGRPSEQDLETPGVEGADLVGKFGVERSYDVWLRGVPGTTKYRVNAASEILSVVGEEPPRAGGTVQTTTDSELQLALEEALTEGLALARSSQEPWPGACTSENPPEQCAIRASGVVIDPRDGSIVAMGSIPSFDPSIFVGGLTQEEWSVLQDKGAFNNFAIQGSYAPASTFKVVAYSLALEQSMYPQAEEDALALQNHTDDYFCSGRLEFHFQDESQQVFNDWTPAGHGSVDLHEALAASCDLYFWELALRVWRGAEEGIDEGALQDWAEQLGFGSATGIDLPFEQTGLVPDREWFETTQRETPGRVRAEGTWSGGDVMNLVIGQGALTSTPLQLANAYAALVNGGTLWQPRVVSHVINADGEIIFENPAKPLRKLTLDAATVTLLRRDLSLAVNSGSGTARSAFADSRVRSLIGGKTGTAEVIQGDTDATDVDTAWFVGVAPIDDPEYVVAIVIERGGSGGRIAAPTARKVLEKALGLEPGPLVAAEDAD
ncbi:MAG: penicillin-binding protein 2 [Acidimicrobiia bacterium]|nr:penicillin-binding protein 2 [Acidimicrobiia bacterium]